MLTILQNTYKERFGNTTNDPEKYKTKISTWSLRVLA